MLSQMMYLPANILEQLLVIFDMRMQGKQLIYICLYVSSVGAGLVGQQLFSCV